MKDTDRFNPCNDWSFIQQKFIPLLAMLPCLWPVKRAKALFTQGREKEAMALVHQILDKKQFRQMQQLERAYLNFKEEQQKISSNTIEKKTCDVWSPLKDFFPFGSVPSTNNIRILPREDKPELVLLLPAIFENAFSAGPNTALRFSAEVAMLGYKVHCISLQYPACSLKTLQEHLKNHLCIPPETISRFYLSDMTEEIFLHEGDHICATASWTLPTAVNLAYKTHTQFPAYLIQDFEPNFLPWSPGHAMLMETYSANFLPIINTQSLADMIFNIGAGSFANDHFINKSLVFQPAVDRTLFYPISRSEEKKILFVYTRFGIFEQRNLYQLALEAISRAVKKGLLPSEKWEIRCYGAPSHNIIDFKGTKTTMLPSLDMQAYAQEIRQANLVLYLVLSPHTGYMPLESAASGVPILTNTYLNKTKHYLQNISPLIFSAAPLLDEISSSLETVISFAENYNKCKKINSVNCPITWKDSFSPILSKIEEWISN